MQTLLIVEDEAFLALELKTMLETAGYRVLTAWSLDAAMPLVESGLLNLAVVDLGLPAASDGAAVARALAARDVPMLVCSGMPQDEARRTLGDIEAIDVLSKPVDPDVVMAKVRSALSASA